MIQELRDLNDTFYQIFEELKEAKPALEGCDAAFISIAQKITEQYELEYKLLDLKHRVETEQEIAKLEARYDRLVPQRWRTRFLHRRKQNYVATLVDFEANEEAENFYAECEARLAEIAAQRLAENAENAQDGQESEDAERGAESASEGNSEGAGTTKAEETEKPQSAADKAMREYLNKKNRKKGKDKQPDKSE